MHGARLHQHVHVDGSPSIVGREPPSGSEQPPYPFKSGESLLNLTRVHNVWLLPCPLVGLIPHKREMCKLLDIAHGLAIILAKDFAPWRLWTRCPSKHHYTC